MQKCVNQLIGLLVSSLLLIACNSTASNVSRSFKPVTPPVSGTSQQNWLKTAQGIFDVTRGEQFIWIATAFGVARLDPVTRAYTFYDQLKSVQRLFPIADDSVYASTAQGHYHFDGQAWSKLVLTSTSPISFYWTQEFGLDAQGDLWIHTYTARASQTYRLTGHIPPRAAPWSVTTPATPGFPDAEPSCDNWPAVAANTYHYRTAAECQRYVAANALLKRHKRLGFYAVEANNSIWFTSGNDVLHLAADGLIISSRVLPATSHLALDPQQGVWVGTQNEGLLFVTDTEVQHVSIGLEQVAQQNFLEGLLVVFGWTLIFLALPAWRAINRLRERRHSQERQS